tara:strand:- start:1212 stop:1868 length:657 start_codon:yes stop_codon:yes gene_type:complete
MNDETTPAPVNNGTTTNGAPVLQHQDERLVPSFRLEQELSAKRVAEEAQQGSTREISELRAQLEKANATIASTALNHNQELHLIDQGFKAPSVRRFFRREYQAAVAELAPDGRPPFNAWLEANREDPLYSVHFERNAQAAAPAAPAEQAQPDQSENLMQAIQAALRGNPNAGAGQPADSRAKDWTVEEMRKLRARNGGTLGAHAEDIKAQWRAKGLIK